MGHEIYAILSCNAYPPGSGGYSTRMDRKSRRTAKQEFVQQDGRIRRWAAIDEAGGKYLLVILLEDGGTVHNAFFDRSFKP